MPASRHNSAKRSTPSGDNSAGLSTTVLPAASAGTTFIAADTIPPFHGSEGGDHAVGLGQRVAERRARVRRGRDALDLVDPAGVVPRPLRGQRRAALALQRRPGLERAQHTELEVIGVDQARQLEQHIRAGVAPATPAMPRTRRRPTPPRRRHRRRSHRNRREHLTGRRVDGLAPAAVATTPPTRHR